MEGARASGTSNEVDNEQVGAAALIIIIIIIILGKRAII
jgi:hypothetical protein